MIFVKIFKFMSTVFELQQNNKYLMFRNYFIFSYFFRLIVKYGEYLLIAPKIMIETKEHH